MKDRKVCSGSISGHEIPHSIASTEFIIEMKKRKIKRMYGSLNLWILINIKYKYNFINNKYVETRNAHHPSPLFYSYSFS